MLSVIDIQHLSNYFKCQEDNYTPDQDIIDRMKDQDIIADTTELSID